LKEEPLPPQRFRLISAGLSAFTPIGAEQFEVEVIE
jgi:hypothetical protein